MLVDISVGSITISMAVFYIHKFMLLNPVIEVWSDIFSSYHSSVYLGIVLYVDISERIITSHIGMFMTPNTACLVF